MYIIIIMWIRKIFFWHETKIFLHHFVLRLFEKKGNEQPVRSFVHADSMEIARLPAFLAVNHRSGAMAAPR